MAHCLEAGRAKDAWWLVREMGLQARFPGAEALYRRHTLRALAERRRWGAAIAFCAGDAELEARPQRARRLGLGLRAPTLPRCRSPAPATRCAPCSRARAGWLPQRAERGSGGSVREREVRRGPCTRTSPVRRAIAGGAAAGGAGPARQAPPLARACVSGAQPVSAPAAFAGRARSSAGGGGRGGAG